MVIIFTLSLGINLAIINRLNGKGENANVKSAFLHFWGDALSDIGAILGGIIIILTNWYGIDSLLSGVLATLILKSAIKMMIECLKILLEAVPKGVSLDAVKSTI